MEQQNKYKSVSGDSTCTSLNEAETPATLLTQEQYALFIQNLPVAVAMFDREMCYLAASRRWIEDYQLSGSIIGRSHYEIFPEISLEWKEVHRRGLAGEVVKSDEDQFVRQDGTIQWLRWEVRPWGDRSHPNGIIIFAEDITERIRDKEQLKGLIKCVQKEKDHLNALLESIIDEVWFTDNTGKIIMANRSGREAFGLSQGMDIKIDRLAAELKVFVQTELRARLKNHLLLERWLGKWYPILKR